jgi:D-lactate dehydrogenase
VTINTGDLVRRLRQENAGTLEQAGWKTAAKHWSATSRLGGVALSLADALPAPLVTAVTDGARAVLGAETVPQYDRGLPGGGKARRPLDASNPIAVYFPACIGTMFGPADGGEGVTSAFLTLCERADVAVRVPEGIGSFCCGTPWKSKGLSRGYAEMGDAVLPALWAASDEGRLPIVCDASSCTEGLTVMRDLVDAHGGRYAALRLVDAVEFTTEHLLPALRVIRRIPSVALHHTCSSTQLGTNDRMTAIAAAIADEVIIPVDWGCCAFAGDRGLLHPELTASATAAEAAEVAATGATAFASSNRTCEIGMSRATGESYQHLIELLEQATRTT